MSPIIFNNPFDLPWQTNLYDLLVLGIFIAATFQAVVKYRRGTRIYAFVLLSALVYGVVLELAGMATMNMYLQGDFAVMLNFPALPLFAGTTAMPLYVTLFYPAIFSIGFTIVEALGITKRWQAAVAGGLFMIVLDAPYIIEGNLRHIVWWTWDSEFPLFQFWLGWPLADMAWQAAFGTVFLYLMLWARPRLDGLTGERWSNAAAFGLRAPLVSVCVIAIGTLLMSPLTIWTFVVGPQWPVMVVAVGAMTAVTVIALKSARPPWSGVSAFVTGAIGSYVIAFLAMIVANLCYEGTVTMYIAVQTGGLIGVAAFATFPLWGPKPDAEAPGIPDVLRADAFKTDVK
jgi:hypothetical protein